MKTFRTFRCFHRLYIFAICPWFCLKERIYYLIQCWIFPSVTIIDIKIISWECCWKYQNRNKCPDVSGLCPSSVEIIIFSNIMLIVEWRSVKYWSKNWQTQKLLSSSSTTLFLKIAAKKQKVTEGTFLSQRGLFVIFVMERTFLSWRGQYCFVGEIDVNKEKLSETSIILHTRATIFNQAKTCTLSVCLLYLLNRTFYCWRLILMNTLSQ